jgi:ABC-2 type transport system permease protein
MSARRSRFRSMLMIVVKDLTAMSRELIFVFMTVLGIVTFVVLYWVLPDSPDDTITLGVRGEGLELAINAMAGESEEGLGIHFFSDTESLRAAVENRDVEVGLNFPDGFVADIVSGEQVTVTIFARPNLPPEITTAMSSMVRELAYAMAGYQIPITEPDEETVILGFDRAGEELALRDRMRPLYAFIVLIMEAVALGALIAAEVQRRTIVALLATPTRLADILTAKILVGTSVAFSEAMLVMLLIQGFGPVPGVVIVALLLGAIMVTGVAMIAGSAGKDLVATMLIGIVLLVPLAIPAFSVLIPGTAAPWVRVLPSYSLVQAVVDVSFYDAGWADSVRSLLTLAGWCVVFAAGGVLILARRVTRL